MLPLHNSELNLSDMVGDESDNIDLSNVVSSKPKEESEESSSNNIIPQNVKTTFSKSLFS